MPPRKPATRKPATTEAKGPGRGTGGFAEKGRMGALENIVLLTAAGNVSAAAAAAIEYREQYPAGL